MATTFNLTTEETNQFFSIAKGSSIIMQLAKSIPTSNARKKRIYGLTDSPASYQTAKFAQKSVSTDSPTDIDLAYYPLYKIYEIDKRDAEDAAFLVDLVINNAAEIIGQTFDQSVVTGVGAPATDFDNLADAAKVVLTGAIWQGLTTAIGDIQAAKFNPTGFALDNQAESLLLGAVDVDGRPIFPLNQQLTSILGRAVKYQTALTTAPDVGVVGDWNQAAWSQAGGIKITKSSEGKHYLENNTVGIRVETEIGFRINSIAAFRNLELAAPQG